MKRLTATAAALILASCAADPATQRLTLSPAARASLDRITATALSAAETAAVAGINRTLRVRPQK